MTGVEQMAATGKCAAPAGSALRPAALARCAVQSACAVRLCSPRRAVRAADAGTQLAGRSLFLAVKAVPLRSSSMGSVAAPRATASGPRRPSSMEVWANG